MLDLSRGLLHDVIIPRRVLSLILRLLQLGWSPTGIPRGRPTRGGMTYMVFARGWATRGGMTYQVLPSGTGYTWRDDLQVFPGDGLHVGRVGLKRYSPWDVWYIEMAG